MGRFAVGVVFREGADAVKDYGSVEMAGARGSVEGVGELVLISPDIVAKIENVLGRVELQRGGQIAALVRTGFGGFFDAGRALQVALFDCSSSKPPV